MTRRVTRLTPDLLRELRERGLGGGAPGGGCGSCVRWELEPVHARRLADAEEAAAEKDAWLSLVLREWGSCGRVALVDDVPVGMALYAPAAFVPGAGLHPTAPVSSDAVVLTALHVSPAERGAGLGRLLVRAMARDLISRGGVRAVEAFGARGTRAAPCLLPADFLAAVGFRTHRAHPTTPRMRMDLRMAVSWKSEVEAAIERLVSGWRPRPSVEPVPRSGPQAVNSSSSLRMTDLGRAPTIVRTTSPPW